MRNFLKPKTIANTISLIILISAFIYMYLGWKEREEALKKVLYFRVKIKSVELGNKGGPCFFYDYYVDDKLYEGNYTVTNENELSQNKRLREFKGDYFYTKVSKKKPKYNQLLIDYAVKDTTLIQPENGWNELPEKIKSIYSDKIEDTK